nr:prepilin-type N-terminal cleavage/methylation domain-containing protein [Cupriavidus basilensis]
MQQRVQQMKKLGRRVQKGFTLIELMIVVAIIGILAAIAIPQYQDYVTRARWSDNITSIAPLKQAIAECIQNNSQTAVATPCDSATNLATANGGGFTAMPTLKNGTIDYGTTAAGKITITGSGQLGPCIVTVTPAITAGSVQWGTATSGVTATGGTTNCTKAQTGV